MKEALERDSLMIIMMERGNSDGFAVEKVESKEETATGEADLKYEGNKRKYSK